jgi:predicted transcriptional regulator YdeE
VLGARVTSDAQVPPGMVVKKIPAQKFAILTSEQGPASKVVPQLWNKINSLPKTAVGAIAGTRRIFEIDNLRTSDPEVLQMDVYVGIK